MKLVGEMHFDTATNYFFAVDADALQSMLELTQNHDQTEPYDVGNRCFPCGGPSAAVSDASCHAFVPIWVRPGVRRRN